MPAPTFVGAGPAAYDLVDAWPASLPISASTPAGVADGDRVICVVTTFAAQNLTVTVPTPTGWTLVNNSAGAQQFNPTGQHVGMWMFSAQWSAATRDQLVAPTSGVVAGRSWRLQCMAWRPSKPFAEWASGRDVGNFTIYTSGFSNFVGIPDGSTILQLQVTRNGSFGAATPFYANLSPTLRVDQPAILNRGGALRLSDATTFGNFTSTGGSWARVFTGSTASIVIGAVIEAPVFDAVGGWAVGRIAY